MASEASCNVYGHAVPIILCFSKEGWEFSDLKSLALWPDVAIWLEYCGVPSPVSRLHSPLSRPLSHRDGSFELLHKGHSLSSMTPRACGESASFLRGAHFLLSFSVHTVPEPLRVACDYGFTEKSLRNWARKGTWPCWTHQLSTLAFAGWIQL